MSGARRRRAGARAAVAGFLGVLAVTSCGNGPDPGRAADGAAGGRLTVFAAASLTDAFAALAEQFEARTPGVEVVLSLGPSSGLATQIIQGAPVDVFASASPASTAQVVDAGLAASARPFATNRAVIAVPRDNPAGITGLADLARPGVTVLLCQVHVPCGALSVDVLEQAGLSVVPASYESDVRAVLTKVGLGEADAGIVYATDVAAAPDTVLGIELPPGITASPTYEVLALDQAPRGALAQDFVTFVLSPASQDVLRAAGFAAP